LRRLRKRPGKRHKTQRGLRKRPTRNL
jgi:hypothetical protein